jgi:hypothetical protein
MKNIIIILIAFLLLLPSNSFSASDKIYSWVDEEGIQHFSDAPTYSVKQESKGTETFLIDRHGRKQIIQPQKMFEVESSKQPNPKQVTDQKAKPNLKSGGGHLNLNIIELFVSSLLPIVFPFFLIILFFIILKFTVLFFLKGFKKPRKNKFPVFKATQLDSGIDYNSPDINSSEFKGFEGEQIVTDLLYRHLNRRKYHFFNDLVLPENQGTTQIDHLIVSEYGIFIVETKNMKGYIYGNPYQKTWVQWLSNGKHPFQNPLHQNYKHKKCLEELLKLQSNVYFDIVIFIEGAKFPKGQPDNVFYPNQFIQFVKSQTKTVLSGNEIDMILSVLKSSMLEPSFETEKRHKAYVKSIIKDR